VKFPQRGVTRRAAFFRSQREIQRSSLANRGCSVACSCMCPQRPLLRAAVCHLLLLHLEDTARLNAREREVTHRTSGGAAGET
jgi:hypothetical protein